MFYVCTEDNRVISVLNYEPTVPSTVSVTTISDEEHQQIQNGSHIFDPISKTIKTQNPSVISEKEKQQQNAVEREFLNSTDWKVLRHIRQKALGISTSLTESQYLELEQQRQAAAARIV